MHKEKAGATIVLGYIQAALTTLMVSNFWLSLLDACFPLLY